MALSSTKNKPAKLDTKAQASGAIDKLFGARQGEQVLSGLKLIQHEHIAIKPQPRTTLSDKEISELEHSITALHERGEGIEGTGILQPLLVTLLKSPGDARYRLVAGERRYRASQKAGIPQIPCLVLTIQESGVLPAQLIENLQRSNLAPLDEARAFQQLRDEQELSLRDIAKSLGKTLGYVTNRLALLKMGTDVQKMVETRPDTLRAAHHIERVTDKQQRADLIHAVLEEGISEREVQRRIEDKETNQSSGEVNQVFSRENTSGGANVERQNPPGSIQNNTEQPSDPIINSLKPAAAFIAEAGRQLQDLRLTADYRQRLRKAINDIRHQLDAVEKTL